MNAAVKRDLKIQQEVVKVRLPVVYVIKLYRWIMIMIRTNISFLAMTKYKNTYNYKL